MSHLGRVPLEFTSLVNFSLETQTIKGPGVKKFRVSALDPPTEEQAHALQFARNRSFFGPSGQKRIEDSYIVVVGLGGVGSHAANMLARSGVGHFRFIDFDVISVSSLNRHAVAVRSDIGKPKVEVLQQHILEFYPTCQIETNCVAFSKDNAASLIPDTVDFVVDAIDDYSTKSDLLEFCIQNHLPIISSMGSGCRSNTTSLLITNITDVKSWCVSFPSFSRRSAGSQDSLCSPKARDLLRSAIDRRMHET